MGTNRRPNGLALITLLVFLFLYIPIVVLIVLSFNESRYSTVWGGFTWKWYALAWRDSQLVASLRMSLLVAFLTALISTTIGTAAALALARARLRLKGAVDALFFLPIVIPEIVIGFATAAFFGAIGLALGIGTVIAAHVAFSISYVIFVVRPRVTAVERSIEEAAMDLGATPWQTFFRVTLPMIMPGVMAAALLVFTISLDDYVITSFVAGPGAVTLPLKIYSMVKTGITPVVNAISSVLLIASIIFAVVAERAAAGRSTRLSLASAGIAAAVLLVFAFGGEGRAVKGGELNVLIWSNYLPDAVIAEFEKRYDARINIELFDSNEAFLSRLQAGQGAYDVIVPSDYMVTILRGQDLLQELDRDLLTNFSNLDPALVQQEYDPANRYSMPYLWGTTGLGYRTDRISEPIDSWSSAWDQRYRDRIAMLDDVRESFAAALRLQRQSINTTDPQAIAEAAELLKQQKPLVKAYDSGAFDQLLLSGDAWIVQGYSGQVGKAMLENSSIRYVIPKEGGTIFIDNLCIPRAAAHPQLAHEFLNFVLEPRIAADIANGTGYSSPNLAARPFIQEVYRDNPAMYPSPDALERCEFINVIGDAIGVYDRFWTEIKSQ